MSSYEGECYEQLSKFKQFYERLIDTAKKTLNKFPKPYEDNIVRHYDMLTQCAYDTLKYLESKKGTAQVSFEKEKDMLLPNLTFYFTVAGPIVKAIKEKKDAEKREKRLAFEGMLSKNYPELYNKLLEQQIQTIPATPPVPKQGGKKKEKSKPRKKKVAVASS